MTLVEKQQVFPKLLVRLFEYAWSLGYEITLGEAWRPPEMAKIYAAQKKGIENSTHVIRLAEDICLWKNGVYLTKTVDYTPLGAYWESLSTVQYQCCWGGRFEDGNHFSILHNGIR